MKDARTSIEAALSGFFVRSDVYGLQEGNCGPITVREPISPQHLEAHLRGDIRVGAHAIALDDTALWGCVDIDANRLPLGKSAEDVALSVMATLEAAGLPCLLEKSKSRGYHIWVCFAGAVPAWKVRSLLSTLVAEAGFPDLEVFPKQNYLADTEGGVGSFVWLPWHGGSEKEARTLFIDTASEGWPPFTNQLVALTSHPRVNPLVLDTLIAQRRITQPTPKGGESRAAFSGEASTVDLNALRVSRAFKQLIVSGWTSGGAYQSRSELDEAVIVALVRGDHTDDEIRAVFENRAWRIGEKYCEHGGGDHYLRHSITKAREFVGRTAPRDGEPGEPESREAGPEETTADTGADKSTARLSQGADEFLSGEIRPVEWAIEDIWPVGDSGLIGGPEKAGKTWLAHEMALSLSTATPFLGKYRVPRQFRVLVWEEEDSRDRMKRRGRQLLVGRNRPMPSPEQLRYLVGHGLKIDRLKDRRLLRAEIEQFRPNFIIVGNLREVHTKNENQPEMAQVRDAFRDLSREFGCAFIPIHHFRKSQAHQNRRGSQMLAGSGVWGAWTEAWMWVTPGNTDDIAICEIGSKDAGGVGKLVIQRRDVMDGELLAIDEDGRKVWPVILGEVERKGRTDESLDEVRQVGEAIYQQTKAPVTIKQIMAETTVKERTVRERVRDLVTSGGWQETRLPRNTKGYVTK